MALRIPDEAAKALGLGDLIPPRATRAARANLDELGMNKLEAKFARHLDDNKYRRDIRDYWFEGVKFRLARKTFLTPDFVVAMPDGTTRVYEVKGGFFRDDARVKIKVAAEMYPHIRWYAVRWVNKEWEFEAITGRGTS